MSQSVDFDQVLQRQHGDSMKWRRYQDQDVVPSQFLQMQLCACRKRERESEVS